ncbi:Winged helix-turn-helix transcription repressor DNA-binding [Penicillium malachiteum]|uniref:Winged helix-turn-helix transcription repressor DNA-binding n=1 Tax=Penicillium malachiteum TaxID=1324776 RepID=A0AAD6HWS5_9EURO|nr:Winged helix-turn-helix transcription repressor DNA-binding [Penicillium malachiteum]
MPTFSYAQAAKGVSETPVATKVVSTEPEKTESKPEEQTNNVPAESVPTISEPDTPQETEKAASSVDPEGEFTTVTSKARSKVPHSRTSSPSVRSTTTQSKEGDSSNTSNGTQDASSEKQAQADTKAEKTDKAENSSEETKEKAGKSDKAEKNTPPKELKAAPLPTVNIWQQRKEAQELKAKTSPVPESDKSASGKATEESQQDSVKTSKKKSADGAQESNKTKKTDGKGRDGALPPVEDASSWPTPQVAIGEEKKKAQEKTDKTEKNEKSPVMRPHGKEKWMPVNYVPTAVFNTPLPSAGRGGGRRPARGGRDGGRGGAHGAGAPAGDKAASGQATPTATGKQASGDRGRNEANTNRATSLPAQPRRSASTDANAAEGRKAQAAERNNRAPRTEDAAIANGKQANGTENASRHPRDGKQFNRNNDSRNGKGGNLTVDPQAAARNNDRRFESGSKSADINREGAGAGGFQEFNREQRGGRSNRGRGGPYSGGFGGQNSQFGNVGNNFVPKNFGFNERQRSQHNVPNGSQQPNRMPIRSPSLPASTGVYGGVYPFPTDINTMYPYQGVNPGPMSAVPFQQYMEPYSLMSMLSMQLEYYFSVDNMCKDMFLRRQMDSQGFVPLNVIASFKRVKSLTEDFELLRHVARQLRNVEIQTGEDGIDRLRPRERWSQWVLPYDQRDAAAQHEGAAPAQPAKNDENVPLSNHADVSNGLSINPGSRQFVPNGTGHSNLQTSLSSTAPEFLPSAQNEIANVGTPKDYAPSLRAHPGPPMVASPYSEFAQMQIAIIDNPRSARRLDFRTPTPHPEPPVLTRQQSGAGCVVQATLTFIQTTDHPINKVNIWSSRREKASIRKISLLICMINIIPPQNRDSEIQDTPVWSSNGDPFQEDPGRYQSWFDVLMIGFDSQMYNEFRRSALDDLFTRHIDHGFNLLMEFYRCALRCHRRIADEVLDDMVGLCSNELLKPREKIFDMLSSAVFAREMDHCNYARVRDLFNSKFGTQWRRQPKSP